MSSPDNVIQKYDENGVNYVTVYQKDYPFNISASDTPTGNSMVFINNIDPDRSTQLPRYDPPKP